MPKKSFILLPDTLQYLEQMGDQIKCARLRRRFSVEQVCERAGVSHATLTAIEKGSPSVAIGSYAAVLEVLNLDKDLLLIAKDEELKRKLLSLDLPVRKRGPKESRQETQS